MESSLPNPESISHVSFKILAEKAWLLTFCSSFKQKAQKPIRWENSKYQLIKE